jgi:hypothetical protein
MDLMSTAQLLGNLGEFVGSIGVIATLVYLAIQVRHSAALIHHNNVAMEESTKLAKVAAIDAYSDSVSRWRGRLVSNPEVATLWAKAMRDEEVQDVDRIRLENLLIDWVNTYRANFVRARAVGDDNLARQAILSVAPAIKRSRAARENWERGRPYNEAAQEFVDAVDAELDSTH